MRPTSITSLVAVFIGLSTATWGFLDLVENRGGVLPPISATAPAGLFALGAVVLIAALSVRSRLRSDDRRPHPLAMARMVVLGKASAHLGPIVGGLYAGYALVLLPTLDIPSRRDRAVLAGLSVLACVLLTVSGLLLERLCRVRGSLDDDDPAALA